MIQKNKKKGFTLVELLAVIVILAIILVIAVPKVMSVIEDSKKATLESSAKMIASAAEKVKVQNTVLGKKDDITCDSVAKINNLDYDTCEIEFEDNTAKVTIAGKGKFAGLYVCNGTKTEATADENSCGPVETSASCFTYEIVKTYNVKDVNACITFFTINKGWTETEANDMCNKGVTYSFDQYYQYIDYMDLDNYLIDDDDDDETLEQSGAFEIEDGIQLTGYDINCGTDVVIPSKIENLDVVTIGEYAFARNGITSVKFPNSIVSIAEWAFASPITGGGYVGEGTGSLSGVVDLSKLSNLRIIGSSAFAGNQITEVYLPDNLYFLATDVFGSNKINKIKLGNSMDIIGLYAIAGNSLTSIEIPGNVTVFSKSSITYNPNLTSIINKTGKIFDWYDITGEGGFEACIFETGTCGNITITSN